MRFQTKIFLWMLGAIIAIVVPMLVLVETKLHQKAEANMSREFSQQVNMVAAEREKRLASMSEGATKIANGPYVRKLLTSDFGDEGLRDVSLQDFIESAYDAISNRKQGGARPKPAGVSAPFRNQGKMEVILLAVDLEGNVKELRRDMDGKFSRRRALKLRLSDTIEELGETAKVEGQQVGYLIMPERVRGGADRLRELLVTPVREDDKLLGWFLMGHDAETRMDQMVARFEQATSGASGSAGFFAEDRVVQVKGLEGVDRGALSEIVGERIKGEKGMTDVQLNGEPYRLAWQEMNPGSVLPSAHQIAFFPLGEMFAEIRDLEVKMALLGLIAVAVAALASFLISRSLAKPVKVLEEATQKLSGGDFEARVEVKSKDELGRLGNSFNEMAGGLALKERYREVLSKVSDEAVAQALVDGQLELGGETRELAVLFCDIRGFTGLTESMTPHEVITLLNEHMTAMTEVVYAHQGVVDKFVGDEIMAVFGAPKAYGNDVENAVRCALAMQEKRRELNTTAEHPFEIGIGVASGDMVAGCMGSVDRLNYTVVGERVNLAARLSAKAGRGEILAAVPEGMAEGEAISMRAKGFTDEVKAVRVQAIGDRAGVAQA